MKKLLSGIFLSGILAGTLFAGESGTDAAVGNEAMFFINNLWIMLGAFLVFIMHLGFACVESGMARAKNCTNILFKNTMTPAIGFLSYALCGFAIMYPGTHWAVGSVFGFAGFGLHEPSGPAIAYNGLYTYWTDFLFQGMFAATAATIVSGAVAERIKLSSYLIFTAVFVTTAYPLIGSWGWGGGWLMKLGFHDLAGSAFVHSVGGFAALAGVLQLGPRIGKYVNGKSMPLMGHNMSLAVIGAFLLWFGWFGFNGASVLSAKPEVVSLVVVNTMFAASASLLSAMVAGKIFLGRPDLSMTLNGCLSGLVGITAAADCVTVGSAVVIGLICGVLVTASVLFLDKMHIDDPVGALSVHMISGVWGTLAVGVFSPDYRFLPQLIGIGAIGAVAFGAAWLIFAVLKRTLGIRVSAETELKGLDIAEHGAEAYPGFQFFSNM